ncbi:OLC1v1000510C1 [Oldenlandia corymbosa var. corymbosa]|uniref:OLC1v1000510C1 n=1 Tax=Oldenlandia corymbosa var. corymbosa TaxID=529605 RepID=A0AAV1D306_OLDCO|nr:OLC1v1000510C1 [Oldenlandia corymbosa var. corymbosa]
MALETVVYQQDLFSSYTREPFVDLFDGGDSGGGGGGGGYLPEEGCDFDELATKFDEFFPENSLSPSQQCSSPNASISDLQIPDHLEIFHDLDQVLLPHHQPQQDKNYNFNLDVSPRFKRRRSRPKKNQEEIERQRMAHIAVERNRRKQMNQYLSVLRGLMPSGYAQKGDQASIVGGAINYVKELEQQLQFLDGLNHAKNQEGSPGSDSISSSSVPFTEFFNYPQYSTNISTCSSGNSSYDDGNHHHHHHHHRHDQSSNGGNNFNSNKPFAVADIEVTMVENSHANLKIRSKKRPKQLLRLVSGLQSMRLTILHLNVTTANQTVLYSLSLKVKKKKKKKKNFHLEPTSFFSFSMNQNRVKRSHFTI